MEMTFNEAAQIAKKQKNTFQAFEKLEDVLRSAVRAEAAADEALEKHKQLSTLSVKLEKRVNDLRDEVKDLEAHILRDKTKAVVQASELWNATEAKRCALGVNIDAMVEAAKVAGEEAKAKLGEEMAALERETVAIEGRLAAARAAFASAKLKVEGLG